MQIEKIPGEFLNLRVKKDGKEISLHSTNPLKEVERVVKHFNPDIPVVLIAGVGLGYMVNHILSTTSYDIILYEHDDTFAPWNQAILDQLTASPRVRLFRGDPQALIDYLADQGIGELNLFIHRPYALLFPQVYDTLHGMLVAYLSRRQINQATAQRFQKLWLRNILKNSLFYPRVAGVEGVFQTARGYPALVIGAGPSLEKNVYLLKRAKENHWILIATDTVLTYLDRLGIEADFVVSVDPQDKNALYLMAAHQRPWLVLDSGASFLTFLHYPLEKILLYDTVLPVYQVFCSFFGKKGELACGGSVSTTAYDFAYRLGCDPIVFVGQDLAYSRRQTHAPHNALEAMLYGAVDRFHTYEGYNATSQTFSDRIEVLAWDRQHTVLTDRKFLTFKEWFVRKTREVPARTINATEGGLFIEGMDHIPLKEVLRETPIPPRPYTPRTLVREESMEGFEQKLRDLLRSLNMLRSSRVPLEERLFALVKEDPLLGRLIEMTMQKTIHKLMEAKQIDAALLDQLQREIREGVAFLVHLIQKRLDAGENLRP